MSPMPFSLLRVCWDLQVILQLHTFMLNFNKGSLCGRNVCAHSLISISCEKNISQTEMFGLKLKLGNCEKPNVLF